MWQGVLVYIVWIILHRLDIKYVSNNNIFLIRGQTIAIDNYVRSGQSWTNIASSYPICTFRSLHWKNHSWNSEIQKCRLISWRMWVKMGKTMPFLPPMTGNGNHTTYKNGDFSGGWCRWHCFTHILPVLIHPHKVSATPGDVLRIRTTALSDCARYSERRKDGIIARFVGKTMP